MHHDRLRFFGDIVVRRQRANEALCGQQGAQQNSEVGRQYEAIIAQQSENPIENCREFYPGKSCAAKFRDQLIQVHHQLRAIHEWIACPVEQQIGHLVYLSVRDSENQSDDFLTPRAAEKADRAEIDEAYLVPFHPEDVAGMRVAMKLSIEKDHP